MEWMLLVAIGLLAGLLAGLFGIGGGIVVVPGLLLWFLHQGVPGPLPDDGAIKLAIGTSIAGILFTGLASSVSHHRRGAVLWRQVRVLAPGLALGAVLGAGLAHLLPGPVLERVFALFLSAVGLKLLAGFDPRAARPMPPGWILAPLGVLFGGLSALVGVGGGTLVGPFLLWHGADIRRAVGTAAACGVAIAAAGTAIYLLADPGPGATPVGTTGYVVWPAVAAVALGAMAAAPAGVRLAHRLPVRRLEQLFALLLLAVGLRMLL